MISSRTSNPYFNHHPSGRCQGAALIAVLWVILLLGSLAAVALSSARHRAISTHRYLEESQANWAAQAAIIDAIGRFYSSDPTARYPVDGSHRPWEFGGINVTLALSWESGRIDLNTASDPMLLAFLESIGISESTSAHMIEALRMRQGQPPQSSIQPGDTPSDSGRRFDSIEDIQELPLWQTPAITCRLDDLTVYTELQEPLYSDATPNNKRAIEFAKSHQIGGRDWIADPSAAVSIVGNRSVFGEPLRIEAWARNGEGIEAGVQWVGRITGDPAHPFLTQRWAHPRQPNPSTCG